MYMIDTWTKEQKAIADATNQGNNPIPQKSIPATSMKSVLKGLI